jgi:hypothetical protein
LFVGAVEPVLAPALPAAGAVGAEPVAGAVAGAVAAAGAFAFAGAAMAGAGVVLPAPPARPSVSSTEDGSATLRVPV